ncbi:hypothetical protein QGP82_14345 [Leptothoe sp. LEGE 181152]|nr:hypothetical protein [Leptothoe sp. LEGE 181152]
MKIESLFKPIYLAKRLQYKLYEIFHPDEPWIAQGAIRWCDKHLTTEHTGLEWGSGRSTLWFSKRLKSLVSIEYNKAWYTELSSQLNVKQIPNVDLRYIELDHPLNAPTPAHYGSNPKYVKVSEEFEDETLDFVVVDGHYRQACILSAIPKIKPGGFLLVDNTNRMPLDEWGVPKSWSIIHQSHNVMTETTIWKKN